MPASASKKASNTPAWLKRQKRFQIEFQFPNVSGRARQVMLWTEKKWSASRKVRSFRPLPPRRERQARNTSRTVSQSSSVIRVSMVGLLKPTHQEAQIRSAGNQQARLLASIRPHGVSLRHCSATPRMPCSAMMSERLARKAASATTSGG
jgi:hypothetical protein